MNTTINNRAAKTPIRVLVIIPGLDIGGAETDLARNLPLLDRNRFKITVCTYLSRGALADKLTDAGIDVIGPFTPQPGWRRSLVNRIKRLQSKFCIPAQSIDPNASSKIPLNQISASPKTDNLSNTDMITPQRMRSFRWLFGALTLLQTAAAPILSGAYIVKHLAFPIARQIRASKIDVVHVILPSAYVVGSVANALAFWRPLVMSRVSLSFYHSTYKWTGFLERHLLHRLVTRAIGNTKSILRELETEGVSKSKLRLIYNGLDSVAFRSQMIPCCMARKQLGIPDNALVLTSVANLFVYKGHADLLYALHLLRDRLPDDWLLLVAGRDAEGILADLLRLTDHLKLSSNVRFLGQRIDVPHILSSSDIHISASHHEGLPNNILEAMCAGIPVVATNVGGVPELVIDQKTGLLVPPKDAKQMSAAIYRLAMDADLRRTMGSAGRLRIETEFSIERSVAAFEKTYAELASLRKKY